MVLILRLHIIIMKIINDNILISEYSIFEEYLERKEKWILINTVNCEWFMGKWIALEFKIRFWNDYFNDYKNKCDNSKINVWKIDYYEKVNLNIINFPTKKYYKFSSKIEWIEKWLDNLIFNIEKWKFDNKIIYIPKLWSSQWGLEWEKIYILIKEKLLNIKNKKVKFIICEDIKAWNIENELLKLLKNYNWNKISEKLLKNINDNFYKIKRLRDLLKIKWIWEKIYKEILNLWNEKELKLF